MVSILDITSAFDTFESIGSTASRLEKESLVESQKDNAVFLSMATHAYDPFKMYYVKKFKIPKTEATDVKVSNYFMFLEVLSQLSKRTLSGHSALDSLESIFGIMSEVEQKWYARILQKDLKIGITSGTVNRTHDALGTGFKIPTFSCALAETYKPKRIPRRFSVEPKLDGYRCLAFRYETHVELRSRNGKPIEGYSSIEKAMENYPPGYVYDGEIMSLSGKFSDMQAMAGRKGVDDKPGIFNIFDVVNINEFFTGTSDELYFMRRARLDKYVDDVFKEFGESPVIAIVEPVAYGVTERKDEDPVNVRAEAEEIIMSTHRELLAKGYEGSMLKDLDGYYECKRSWGIQKVKDMETLDLLVIGVEPGIPGTRLEGTMASIVVEYKGYSVNVGSGFSDELRAEIWNSKENVINRIAEIKYFEESKDKKGNLSLRFPIFIQFRYDKE